MLFRHASMQKIRHCCQNLNLLPYLLYSFDNSKSHPIARKMHVYLSRFLQEITISLLVTYESLRQSVLHGIRIEKPINAQKATTETDDDPAKPAARFNRFKKPKRKHSCYLTAAVYLVPLLLVFQMLFLGNLTIFGKYTPGFIFLITSLLFLGGIALKILLHETVMYGIKKCERKKMQWCFVPLVASSSKDKTDSAFEVCVFIVLHGIEYSVQSIRHMLAYINTFVLAKSRQFLPFLSMQSFFHITFLIISFIYIYCSFLHFWNYLKQGRKQVEYTVKKTFYNKL